jgi:hypothetical protein
MTGLEHLFILLGIVIGISIGAGIMFAIGFVTEMYTFWQLGRFIAVQVTEREHKRRLETLTKMIELERARQPVEIPADPTEPIRPMAEMKREDG